jgi:hypothetical protein
MPDNAVEVVEELDLAPVSARPRPRAGTGLGPATGAENLGDAQTATVYSPSVFGVRHARAKQPAREGYQNVSQIFLSYSPQDERAASTICAELRRDHGLDVWWDGEVPRGNDWMRQVSRALNRCDGMIVLVSPAAMTSDLVKREVEHALTSDRFQDRLFPLIIRPTKHVPGCFSLTHVFDATENRKRGLKGVAKAIIASDSSPGGADQLLPESRAPR